MAARPHHAGHGSVLWVNPLGRPRGERRPDGFTKKGRPDVVRCGLARRGSLRRRLVRAVNAESTSPVWTTGTTAHAHSTSRIAPRKSRSRTPARSNPRPVFSPAGPGVEPHRLWIPSPEWVASISSRGASRQRPKPAVLRCKTPGYRLSATPSSGARGGRGTAPTLRGSPARPCSSPDAHGSRRARRAR